MRSHTSLQYSSSHIVTFHACTTQHHHEPSGTSHMTSHVIKTFQSDACFCVRSFKSCCTGGLRSVNRRSTVRSVKLTNAYFAWLLLLLFVVMTFRLKMTKTLTSCDAATRDVDTLTHRMNLH